MTRYLLLMSALMTGAIGITVAVFMVVAFYDTPPLASNVVTEEVSVNDKPAVPPGKPLHEVASSSAEDRSDENNASEYTAIPLTDVPLSEAQLSALEFIGVDAATYEITPATQACAIEELGETRVREIIAGDVPSVSELWSLQKCL